MESLSTTRTLRGRSLLTFYAPTDCKIQSVTCSAGKVVSANVGPPAKKNPVKKDKPWKQGERLDVTVEPDDDDGDAVMVTVHLK